MTPKQIAKKMGFKTGYAIIDNEVIVTIDDKQKHIIGYSEKYKGFYYKTNDWHHSHNGNYIMTSDVVKSLLYKSVIDKTK